MKKTTLLFLLIFLSFGSLSCAQKVNFLEYKIVEKKGKMEKMTEVSVRFTTNKLHARFCEKQKPCVDFIFSPKKHEIVAFSMKNPQFPQAILINEKEIQTIAQTFGQMIKGLMEAGMQKKKQQQKQQKPKVEKKSSNFRKIKSGVKMNGYVCDLYAVYEKGKKTGEACIASYASAGVDKKAIDAMIDGFIGFMQYFIDQLQLPKEYLDEFMKGANEFLDRSKWPFEGIPVSIRPTSPPKVGATGTLTLLQSGKKAPEPWVFQIPDIPKVGVTQFLQQMMQQMMQPPQQKQPRKKP